MLFVKFQSAPYESIHEITRLWLQCWRISKARNLGKEILHSSCSQLQCWNQMRWLQCLWWNFIRIFILKEFLTEDSNRIDLNRISKNRQLYGILAFSRKFYQEMEAERSILEISWFVLPQINPAKFVFIEAILWNTILLKRIASISTLEFQH